MTESTRIAVDTSKHVFTVHGVATDGEVIRRDLRREQPSRFFNQQTPCVVALETCGGSHQWGQMLQAFGHTVRLIPPQYVNVRAGDKIAQWGGRVVRPRRCKNPSAGSSLRSAQRAHLGHRRSPVPGLGCSTPTLAN